MSNSETLYASVESFQKNVGIAFALVIASGLSTCLGACIVFFPTLIQLANKSTLAISLGFSAGVMAYVSFVEILQKSYLSFLRSGMTRQRAYQWSTLCFFGGVLIMVVSLFHQKEIYIHVYFCVYTHTPHLPNKHMHDESKIKD
jgi:zinc transporter ZupT